LEDALHSVADIV